MIVLLAGSREWVDPAPVRRRMEQLPRGTVIRHGGAPGLDQLSGVIARRLGFPVEEYRADWKNLNRGAGAQRTIEMLKDEPPPGLALCYWLDGSRGTYLTIEAARKLGIPIEVTVGFTYPVTVYDPSPARHAYAR